MSCPGTPSLVLRSIAISQVVVIAESVIGPLVVIVQLAERPPEQLEGLAALKLGAVAPIVGFEREQVATTEQ